MTTEQRDTSKFVYIAVACFVLTCALLFALGSWLAPTGAKGFDLTERATVRTDGVFQLTINTSDRHKWVPLNLSAGRVATATETADLHARRYVLQAPGGAIDLGSVNLMEATKAASSEWSSDEVVDGEVQNTTLSSWYSYSYWTHLLEARDKTYAVRLAQGGTAFIRFISYYCKPEGSGCLTIQYRLERG